MIKWLICFIWGHDLNKDPKNYAKIISTRHDTGVESITGMSSQCLRCLKFKSICKM